MARNKTSCGGIGFGGALALIFITLKLCGVITWSWCWVLCPLWAPLVLIALFVLACLIGWILSAVVIALIEAMEAAEEKKRKRGK
jgi:hypothetical protein